MQFLKEKKSYAYFLVLGDLRVFSADSFSLLLLFMGFFSDLGFLSLFSASFSFVGRPRFLVTFSVSFSSPELPPVCDRECGEVNSRTKEVYAKKITIKRKTHHFRVSRDSGGFVLLT
eukprot:TRINITY_DN5275_c0_g1_i1.p1 TRINITY_DN5275_c0_g1~~TRINITY_DN5275_c0_g1_i1.p1  ORF type:complete len:117 (-),score=14.88 TRINITY_DN5275_c0_g1_i1:485-835(-)